MLRNKGIKKIEEIQTVGGISKCRTLSFGNRNAYHRLQIK